MRLEFMNEPDPGRGQWPINKSFKLSEHNGREMSISENRALRYYISQNTCIILLN